MSASLAIRERFRAAKREHAVLAARHHAKALTARIETVRDLFEGGVIDVGMVSEILGGSAVVGLNTAAGVVTFDRLTQVPHRPQTKRCDNCGAPWNDVRQKLARVCFYCGSGR